MQAETSFEGSEGRLTEDQPYSDDEVLRVVRSELRADPPRVRSERTRKRRNRSA